MVEFFDYNCGYCKRALTDMVNLMKADPKLKVVLKEFPVLGPGSVEAAQVATAVRMQDRTGKKYLEFHQKLLTGRGQVDRARALAVAKEVGLDMARLEKDMAGEEVRASLEESMKLADKLGLNGTPSYVVGPDVVVGAVGYEALTEKIEVGARLRRHRDVLKTDDGGGRSVVQSSGLLLRQVAAVHPAAVAASGLRGRAHPRCRAFPAGPRWATPSRFFRRARRRRGKP